VPQKSDFSFFEAFLKLIPAFNHVVVLLEIAFIHDQKYVSDAAHPCQNY